MSQRHYRRPENKAFIQPTGLAEVLREKLPAEYQTSDRNLMKARPRLRFKWTPPPNPTPSRAASGPQWLKSTCAACLWRLCSKECWKNRTRSRWKRGHPGRRNCSWEENSQRRNKGSSRTWREEEESWLSKQIMQRINGEKRAEVWSVRRVETPVKLFSLCLFITVWRVN